MPSKRKIDYTKVKVRPAREADLTAIDNLIDPWVEGKKLLPRTHDELQQLLQSGFVAVAGRRVVGFAALEVYSKKMAELRSLAVAEEAQGHGIGRKLVEACIDLAKHRRIFEVIVITSADQFFHKCGFDFTLPGEKKALFLQTREAP